MSLYALPGPDIYMFPGEDFTAMAVYELEEETNVVGTEMNTV